MQAVVALARPADHHHTVAHLQPGEHALGVLHAGFPSLGQAERPHEELQGGHFVPVGEPGVDGGDRASASTRRRPCHG